MAKIKKTKIEDLIPDDLNFNKGTQFGQSMIEKSLRTFGAGRSILLDKNNKIIAGNKTTEGFASAGMEDVIIIETTGNELVAVKRNDIDLDTKEGRELALADNATAAANLDWDEEAIAKAKVPNITTTLNTFILHQCNICIRMVKNTKLQLTNIKVFS